MSTPEERHLKQLNDVDSGRKAALAWNTLQPILQARSHALTRKLLTAYRAGDKPRAIYNLVSDIVALDDLEQVIRAAVQRGERVGKEVLNGGPGIDPK